MPRRAVAASDDEGTSAGSSSSHKENRSANGVNGVNGVKAEKVNGKGKGKRRASTPEDEEEDDEQGGEEEGEEEEDNEEEEGSPKGRKRARVSEEGDGEARQPKRERVKIQREKVLERDPKDGYVAGSIVRVKLHNFVTYDDVEFKPGPHLNMIIGPNGTGKSSIACAIALGLNFPPSVLGRANDINLFVKQGTDEGFVEIELKGRRGKPNLVIRRGLKSTSKSSTYSLNGQSATGREVTMRMNELNIQVGNLCSFLPQDKVSEFAQMTPAQLLRETQRAAGDERLSAWHETLINAGKEAKEMQELLDADRAQLKTLEERNRQLENEVDRFHERKKIEDEIAILELLLPFALYMEARARYTEAKNLKRDLHAKAQALERRNGPMLRLKASMEAESKELQAQREKKKGATKTKFKALEKKLSDNEHLSQQAESIADKLQNLKKNEKERKEKIRKGMRDIEKLQEMLDNPPEMENVDDIMADITEVNHKNQEVNRKNSDLQERQRAVVDRFAAVRADRSSAEQTLRNLNDEAARRLLELSKFDKDCADTIFWLRSNRHLFQMEIFEPAIVSLTVPDRRYASAVEACFSAAQLRTFVCQCDDDYRLLNKLITDSTEALGRKARITTWFKSGDGEGAPAPLPREQLAKYGFDGYAVEYVKCPDGLYKFLSRDVQLHRTPIALNPINHQQYEDIVSIISNTGSGNFITKMTMNRVMRSAYGQRLAQTGTHDFQPARNFIHTPVDDTLKRESQQKLNEAEERLIEIQKEIDELAVEEKAIRDEFKAIKNERDHHVARREKVVRERAKIQKTAISLENKKNQVKAWEDEPPVDEERAKLQKQLLDSAKKRAAAAKQYADLLRGAIKDQDEATKLGLRFLQVESNIKALQQHIDEKDGEYREALAQFQRALAAYEKAKEEGKTTLAESKEAIAAAEPELREKFTAMEESGEAMQRTSEQILAELETLRTQLDLILGTNPGVVDQYERRKAEIASLTKKIEEREAKAAKIEKNIKTARDNWEPALDELVHEIGSKFSAAFDRIGCAGEIQLHKPEDYDKWAINIFVKFRDHEQLQQLTAQRQSGGERSLTTILYLMSMTEQAHAPFSLVDEINQGMDQRAERTVHNELVKTTCRADSGQYFLITPKLLPDLNYHKMMKVLCVNNGEWLPEDRRVGSMMGMIETYVQMKRGGGGAASA